MKVVFTPEAEEQAEECDRWCGRGAAHDAIRSLDCALQGRLVE
jgi:hypothetical protein